MKFSHFLGLLQIIVIAVLAIKVVDLSNQLQAIGAVNHSSKTAYLAGATNQNTSSVNTPTPQLIDPICQTDETVSKQISNQIHSEFAKLHASIALLQPEAEFVRDELVDPQELLDQAAQLNRVNQELDFYINQGVLSDKNMESLLSEIAQLPATERRNMMRKLVKAMNLGQIDARF